MYTPGWQFITTKGAYIGRWLNGTNTAAFGGTTQNAESWQTNPTTNPDKIYLLRTAFFKGMGRSSPEFDAILEQFGQAYYTPLRKYYKEALTVPGWYGVGCKKDVPKEACFVGHCGNTFVWVLPDNTEHLANFTLAILDIVTATPKQWYTLFKPRDKAAAEAAEQIKSDIRKRVEDRTPDDPKTVLSEIAPQLMKLPLEVQSNVRAALIAGLPIDENNLDVAHKQKIALIDSLDTALEKVFTFVPSQEPSENVLAPRETLFPYPAPPVPPAIP
jgi:hypothetical protein